MFHHFSTSGCFSVGSFVLCFPFSVVLKQIFKKSSLFLFTPKKTHEKSIQIQPVRRLYKHVVCQCFTLKFTIWKAPSKPGTSAHQTLRTCADASATSVLHNEISESSSWSAPSAMSWPASRGHGSKFWRPRISKNIIMEVWWSMAIRAISFVSNHKNTIRQLQTTKDNGIAMDCSNELMTAAHHFRAICPINCKWCMHFQWCTLDSCNQLRANQIRIFDQEKLLKQLLYCSHLFGSFLSNKQTNKQTRILCKLCPRTVHRPQGVCQTASASGLELHQVENVWKCFSASVLWNLKECRNVFQLEHFEI